MDARIDARKTIIPIVAVVAASVAAVYVAFWLLSLASALPSFLDTTGTRLTLAAVVAGFGVLFTVFPNLRHLLKRELSAMFLSPLAYALNLGLAISGAA